MDSILEKYQMDLFKALHFSDLLEGAKALVCSGVLVSQNINNISATNFILEREIKIYKGKIL
jgi:hypothetical protein